MPLSKDIKTMLATLRAGGDTAPVIACLEKWDKVHDKFYEDCKKPTPLRIRKGCPCWRAANRNNGHISPNDQYACDVCRDEEHHYEERCDYREVHGCIRTNMDPFEEAMEEAAEYEETFGRHRKR